MSEEKYKLERIVELLMSENNTLKAALLESERRVDNGLTMRDHFAGLAMQAIISKHYHNNDVSALAYEHADAMLEARDKVEEEITHV